MNGGIMMAKEIIYSKPNMANLRGKAGRRIIREIMNTPPADHTGLQQEVEEMKKRFLAERANETSIAK